MKKKKKKAASKFFSDSSKLVNPPHQLNQVTAPDITSSQSRADPSPSSTNLNKPTDKHAGHGCGQPRPPRTRRRKGVGRMG